MNGPLISVVIPTRNRAYVLYRALESLRSQTHSHWESIVVDDYSSDATWRALGYIKDSRIRYVRNTETQGVVHARNLGSKEARGEFICYLDDDNQFFPTALEALSEMPDQATWGAWYRNITLIRVEDQRVTARHRGTSAGRTYSKTTFVSLESSIDSNCLFHRPTILQEIGGWDTLVEPTAFEDTYLCARLALKRYNEFWLLPQVLVDYQTTVGTDGDGAWGRYGNALQARFAAEWLQRYENELTADELSALNLRVEVLSERATRGESNWVQWFDPQIQP